MLSCREVFPCGGISSNGSPWTFPAAGNQIRLVLSLPSHITQGAEDVVEIGHHHEQDEKRETGVFGANHKRFAGFAAGDDFVKEEEHMPAVECRDGEDVHEGEDDAEEGRHEPEDVPVPNRWEEAADGSEATELLGSVCRKEVAHVAHIALEHVHAVGCARRKTLEESVCYMRLSVAGQNVEEGHAQGDVWT